MTLKVVQGLIGQGRLSPSSDTSGQVKQQDQHARAAVQGIATAATLSSFGTTEATVSAVKGRQSGNLEKIRDSKEAERVADEVSDRIREDSEGEASQAHGRLDQVSARHHLSN